MNLASAAVSVTYRCRYAADQERLLSQDIVFETVGKLAVKRSDANQVLHIEVA